MKQGGVEQDDTVLLDQMLQVARRDAFLFTIALGQEDPIARCVAAAHLRWSMAAALAIVRRAAFTPRLEQVATLDALVHEWDPIQQRFPLTSAAIVAVSAWPHVGEALPICAAGGTFSNLDLNGMELNEVDFSRALLQSVDLRNVPALRARFGSARLTRCRVGAAELIGANFDASEVEFSNFSLAFLALSSWQEAIVLGSKFDGADFFDTRLEHAVFAHCDFRGVNFGCSADSDTAELPRAHFLHCDLRDTRWHGRHLRGAVFEDCAFRGAFGAVSLDDVHIVRPDLSEDANGTQLGTIADVAGALTRTTRARPR